ncbi:FkbM family methyltransferase, partial [bacterium]|nr:FkbM family methyltransferase [bacterium]
MNGRFRAAAARLAGPLRRRWRRWRPPRVAAGPARGLRLDPGAGDPDAVTGRYEAPVQAVVAAELRAGDVVLDVGANIGFLTVLAARLVGPAGRVVAFEPVPANARLVRRNAALNGQRQVQVVEAAAGDHDGTATLVLARHAGGAALQGAARPPDACGALSVPIVTLDAWLAGHGASLPGPVRLVKIDVEGAEAAVLRGAAALLGEQRPLVLLEVDAGTAAGAEAKYEVCRELLAGHGYRVERLPEAYPGL